MKYRQNKTGRLTLSQLTTHFLSTIFVLAASAQSSQPADKVIKFVKVDASSMDGIIAIALQTHLPIAIVFGKDSRLLCENKQPMNLTGLSVREALTAAVASTQSTVVLKNGVLEVLPPDLTSWQKSLLDHRFLQYPPQAGATMNELIAQLNGWMLAEAEGAQGYATSTLSSTSAPRFSLPQMYGVTVEEVADRIATLDKGGVWVLKSRPEPPKGLPDDEIQIYSYREDSESIAKLSCAPSF